MAIYGFVNQNIPRHDVINAGLNQDGCYIITVDTSKNIVFYRILAKEKPFKKETNPKTLIKAEKGVKQ